LNPRSMLLVMALLLAGPAYALDTAAYDHLSTEMEALAKRDAWQGVERKYLALEALEMEIQSKDLVIGAQSARNLGDAYHCRERLIIAMTRSTEGGETFSSELSGWLGDLQTNYGPVHLVAKNGAARLGSKQSFFQPDRRTATKFAAETLMDTGEFNGLLPVGVYIWGGEVIDVVAGTEVPERRKLKKTKSKRQYW
jgi:hypothetical protein